LAAIKFAADTNQVYFPPSDPRGRASAFAMLHRCGREHLNGETNAQVTP
jgi:hypothetical protein